MSSIPCWVQFQVYPKHLIGKTLSISEIYYSHTPYLKLHSLLPWKEKDRGRERKITLSYIRWHIEIYQLEDEYVLSRISRMGEIPPLYHDWQIDHWTKKGLVFECYRREGNMKDINWITQFIFNICFSIVESLSLVLLTMKTISKTVSGHLDQIYTSFPTPTPCPSLLNTFSLFYHPPLHTSLLILIPSIIAQVYSSKKEV